ncbi:MAG: 3-phosphoshikimate 1-carboxyvinyltransferase [Ectothiorhodospiraceae bacterium]|nr:3-phosphoshikimate 1-carboxyvinyltransferase [Chromatiales bacterium]MCP5156892.1 3-phosphoshikimate 1-carboxyvinyltransferase [Ectothiorhodospiraceae bacterium]
MSDSKGLTYRVEPGGSLHGELRVPGDKSISHRSVILGAVADGTTEVDGFLQGHDTLATANAFRALGVRIDQPSPGRLRIHGVGMDGLRPPAGDLDLGNSGTAMRLIPGALVGQALTARLVGDASLSRRPMRRITEPLARMGAVVRATENGTPPLVIEGRPGGLTAIEYDSPVASAQVKSCLLLAGLWARGTTVVREPGLSRDHTERMLRAFGAEVEVASGSAAVRGGQRLRATPIGVPADISSAAFFMVGAAIAPGSRVRLRDVGINPTRAGVIAVLDAMGARLRLIDQRLVGGEPVADIEIEGSELRGIDIPPELVPSAIDEFPALFVAAACARGETRLSGAAELRVKESDRIAAMADGLQRMGVDATPTTDGMVIVGRTALHGATVDSLGDHRIAMAFAMAALRADGPVRVEDCDNVATSFPGFVELARGAGLGIEAER